MGLEDRGDHLAARAKLAEMASPAFVDLSAGRFLLLFLELPGLAQAALWRWIT